MTKLTNSEFFAKLVKGVYGPRQGGARIIVDAEDAATGVGKTSLAVALALALSKIFDYEIGTDDLTLSGSEYLKRWKEHPDADQPSVLVLDELSGGGAGDARRAMSNQNVNLGRSWQLMRKKRIVTITTLPHWSDADKKMRRFADYRLWCLSEPIGYFRAYSVGSTFDDGSVRTRKLDEARIRFPNLAGAENALYEYLSRRKDDLLDSDAFDADEVEDSDDYDQKAASERYANSKDQKIKLAQDLRDQGVPQDKIAEVVGFNQSWVSRNTEERSHTDESENRKAASP